MIVNYIVINFSSSTIQEDFNEAVIIAISSAKSNTSVISKVRAIVRNDSDKVELFNAFYEYHEETYEYEFKVVYFTERMKSIGIVSPSGNDIKSYVYIVSWNRVWDGELIDNSNKVFASKEDAFKFYMDLKKDEIDLINDRGVSDDWVENDDNWQDLDTGNAVWEYYKDYEYSNYHSCIYVDKREVL